MAAQSSLSFFSEGNNAREIAYRAIRDKIIYFELKPGEAVSDKLLAEELNMSRTPVREALILLTTSNMVLLKPQAGTFVAPIDVEWMDIEQFSRKAIEKEVITQAMCRITPETVRLYEENNRRFDEVLNSPLTRDSLHLVLDVDNDFHSIPFNLTGHEGCCRHLKNNMQHIERLRVLSILVNHSAGLSDEHRRISDAIVGGDLVSALYWVDKHMVRYRESLEIAKRTNPEYFELG